MFISRVLVLALILFAGGCTTKKDFEFCFTTIVNGRVFVTDAQVGSSNIPCGFLSSVNGPSKNNQYDFEKDRDLCGAIADGYRMEIPDSASVSWGNHSNGQSYEKTFVLPPFPQLNPGEKYRVGFCIGYQDCVYVRVETVPRY